MKELREVYKGRNIVAKLPPATDTRAAIAAESQAPMLYIDDKPVVVREDSSGMYIAAGLAYAPKNSLTELAKTIIDYQESTSKG